MNREEQQAREIDSIRRALERKPAPPVSNIVWLNSKIKEPESKHMPALCALLALTVTAAAYFIIDARLNQTTTPAKQITAAATPAAPVITPRPQITYAPTPAPTPPAPTRPQRAPSLYITTTRPTPRQQQAPASQPQHRPAPEPVKKDYSPQHAAVARNYLAEKKSVYASPVRTEPVAGWKNRYRSHFEIDRTSTYGGKLPGPRYYTVLTELKNGRIIGVDITSSY
ncbi:MAG: hypothetical protein ABII82_16930 [Verrucomicrobiota bacterium]